MEPDDELSKTFTDLTALFEDAAALAAKGQPLGLANRDRPELIRKLRKTPQEASTYLDGLG